MRVPSSTPCGIVTDKVFSRCTRPLPLQASQGSEITRPVPAQVGQVRSIVKKPCCARTRPAPRQLAQTPGGAPLLLPVALQTSQRTVVGTRIWACLPVNASSRVISRL